MYFRITLTLGKCSWKVRDGILSVDMQRSLSLSLVYFWNTVSTVICQDHKLWGDMPLDRVHGVHRSWGFRPTVPFLHHTGSPLCPARRGSLESRQLQSEAQVCRAADRPRRGREEPTPPTVLREQCCHVLDALLSRLPPLASVMIFLMFISFIYIFL